MIIRGPLTWNQNRGWSY